MSEANLLLRLRRRLPPANEKEALEAVARGSGVPVHTLRKIVTGETENPRVKTVEQLLKWVER